MSERTRIQRKKNHDGERDLAPPIVHEALLGHAAGGIHIDHTAPAPQLQPKLIVNQPGDIYEQEADRVADMVVNGSRALIGSFTAIPSVQRDTAGAPPPQTSGQLPPDAEFPLTDSGLSAGKAQAEALEAISEAIQETPAGQELTRKAAELGADLWSHLEGKVVVIVSGAAALGALLAANGELPVSIPSIPLDWAVPGLKANLTYEGPLRDPSKVMLTLTLSFGGAVTDAGPTSRPTNDAQADEIRRFQQSIHYAPGTPEAREELARKAAYEQWLLSRLPSPGHFGDLTTLGFSSSNERQGANPAADQTNPFQLTPPTFGEDLGKSRFPRLAPELSLDEPLIMRKAPGSAEGMDAPPVVQEVLQSSGHTLDDTTRAYMEPRFGQHFGHVRVHTDPTAARSAESVSALAYTVGNDVVFGAGQYQPGTDAGKRLIAHELTHVVQQREARPMSLGIVHRQEQQASQPRSGQAALLDKETAGSLIIDWLEHSTKAIEHHRKMLFGNWSEFIGFTAPNSRLAWSDSQLYSVVSNAVGNGLSQGVEVGLQRLARTGVVSGIGLLIGSAAGPLGSGIGFVVGVLVESVASAIFDALNEKPGNEQMSADTSEQTAKEIRTRTSDFDEQASKSNSEKFSIARQLRQQLALIQSQEELDHFTDSIRKDMERSKPEKPIDDRTMLRKMMVEWVLENAADEEDANKDTNEEKWQRAKKNFLHTEGDLDNRPDLFAYQTRRHWAKMGLNGENYINEMLTYSKDAEVRYARNMFDGKRYTFSATSNWQGLYKLLQDHTTSFVYFDFQVEMLRNNEFILSCTLDLEEADGTISVDEWDYSARYTGNTSYLKQHQIEQRFSVSPDSNLITMLGN